MMFGKKQKAPAILYRESRQKPEMKSAKLSRREIIKKKEMDE